MLFLYGTMIKRKGGIFLDQYSIFIFIASTVCAVLGLIVIILEKKGIWSPLETVSASGAVPVSSGFMALLFGTIFGTVQLYGFSAFCAAVYALFFLVLFILVQVMFRKK